MPQQLPRACIIGAGSSGLPAVKALKDAGIPFDCFETSDRVGGLWVYDNASYGLSGAYRGLNANAPKGLMQYSEYHLPASYPAYPTHSQFAEYFQAYAEHFDLLPHITFNTTVERVMQAADASLAVTLSDGTVRRYDCALVANGHHWSPRWPQPPFPGTFGGEQMHSHTYRTPEIAHGKNVVVVGLGNSAMDISSEVSLLANRTYLSARSGVPITSKYVFGKPPPPWAFHLFSFRAGRRLMDLSMKLIEGSPESYGLPKPQCLLGETHPSGSDQIFTALRRGRIQPKPNIAELLDDKVRFCDGTVESVDLIIYCTGYNIDFPFFDQKYISAPDNEIHLFKQVFDPDHPRIIFIGLCQPLGSIQPLAEMQSKWVADYLTGHYALPDETRMRKAIGDDALWRAERFVKSARNTIEVDHFHYARSLRKEIRIGRRRATGRLPFTATARDDPTSDSTQVDKLTPRRVSS